VALKLLTRESASEGDRKRHLLLEAQAASTLNHPNVAQIYEIAEAEGIEFIAMEYVPGRTLSALLRERRLQPTEVVEIAVQVADALEEAHAKGVIHRDIKPSNIMMITPRGRVKVLDFGIAKMSAAARKPVAGDSSPALKTDGALMGTPEYMSPEQALGLDVDVRSDIFSFGSMLYEMASCGSRRLMSLV
jgi:serine/threonine protein kinase